MKDNKIDEREDKLMTESIAIAGCVAFFYSLFILIYKLIKTKDLSNAYVELGLVMIMIIVMYLHRTAKGIYNIPTRIGGRPLPTGTSKEDKKARLLYYIKDSLSFAILLTIFNYAWKGQEGLLFKIEKGY